MADVSFDGVNLTGSGTYSSNISASGDLISKATDTSSTIKLSNNTINVSGEYYHDLGNIVFENGTTTTISSAFNIRGDNTSTPAVTIDGTFTSGNFVVGKAYNSGATKGLLNITDNANITARGFTPIGNYTNAQGTVNQSGGSITFTNEVTKQADDFIFRLGAQPASIGTYNLSGGTLTCVNAKLCVGYHNNATGIMNITGGTANFKGIKLTNNNGTKGTLNLYGGELNIAGDGITKGNGTATINLGQGTVSALASHTWNSALAINLNGRVANSESDVAGGVTTFNTADKTITIAGSVSGVGALTKTGAGALTLSQAPTYTGSTTVSAGTLTLSAGGTLYNLSGGSESNPATLTVTGDLTLSNDDESTFIGSITAQKITVNTANDIALKLYTGANNKVTADSLTVSSGELDFKGYFSGNIEVFNGSVFSPGNSVGTATIKGDITFADATADSNGVALFEFGEYADGADVNHDLFVMESGGVFTADDGVILLDFAYNDENSWATVGNEFQLVSGGGFEDNVDYNPWLGNMTDLFKLEGRSNDGLYLVGIKAAPEPGSGVPEPSTWALLLLGAAGLMYWRKRTRK